MADTKVSNLPVATSVGGSDVLYLVQNNTSKKITAAKFFENAANVTLKGNLNLDSSVQTLAAPGLLDLTKLISHVSAGASNGTLSILPGTPSQVKIVVMTATTGGTYTLSGNIANNANVVFNAAGKSATLLYTNNKWFVIGGTAQIT